VTLAGQVAIVTGSGGQGSGRAVARRFAREGATVIVSDIDRDGGAETLRLIAAEGDQADFVACDMRSEEEVFALIETTAERFGRLDILVNNASSPHFHPERPLDFWDDIVATDLQGTMWATRFAIDAMRQSGGGAIVNFSSTSALGHGRLKTGGSPGYDAAKAGILRLTTMLAFLAEADNIRVNCIAPDWIATPELQAFFEALTPEEKNRSGAPQKLTTLDEIADAVLLLATDTTLAGRVMVWWSDAAPKLIAWGDPGVAAFE
jgi:NAD(P)-dependent dehydrogenase (short-subunit alcohol dehydrogenase family)